MKKLFRKIKELAKDGLFHIFGGSVVAKIVGVISSVVVIRGLPKLDYGHYVSANNLFSYFTAFVGLGLANAALQYCSEKVSENKKNGIHAYSMTMGMVFNILVTVMIFLLSAVKQWAGDEQVAHYLRLMAGLPFVIYANTYLQIVLRIKGNNQAFSFTNMMYSVSMLAGNVVFTMWLGIEGLILSTYLANVLAVGKSCLVLNKDRFFKGIMTDRESLSRPFKKELVSYGGVYATTAFSGMVLLLLDVTCLDLIVRNPVTLADYKVASTIPMAFSFVPSCLIVYFYPKMVAAFSEGKQTGRKTVRSLSKLFFAVNGGVFVVMLLAAPLLIWLGFGEKYMNVVPVFRLLCFNYLVHAVQSLLSHVLAVIKRLKANLLLSLLSGLANIGLNILLIPLFGTMGAALATLSVTCLITLLYFVYLQRFYRQEEQDIKE